MSSNANEYPYFCTDCNELRSRLTDDGRCTMCHGLRIIETASRHKTRLERLARMICAEGYVIEWDENGWPDELKLENPR